MIYIKDWFLREAIQDSYKRGFFEQANEFGEVEIVKETEKAIFVQAAINDCGIGTIKFWCPKSCIYTQEEVKVLIEKANERFLEGKKRYEKLLVFAKENGIAVRAKMKKETILNKIKQAGLVYEY